jgi:hypothetical protein
MYKVRQVLKLSGGCSSFSRMKSGDCLQIDDSVEIVGEKDFKGYESLEEIILSSSLHLREIRGFQECASLCRIEIPSSVEMITFKAFFECTSLKEVIFSSDSHLREIGGFCGCRSLCRIEIPLSVEIIDPNGFLECTSLNEILFHPTVI